MQNLISPSLSSQIKQDLKPHFETDLPDKSGFFPSTTQRASGLLGFSDACAELATNPLFINVANAMVSSTHTFSRGDHRETVHGKPIISSTVGFRVNLGGSNRCCTGMTSMSVSWCVPCTSLAFADARESSDYHPHDAQLPVMIDCVTALTKTTKENGATIAIPGSHLWGPERRPKDEETVPVELAPGDALVFLGNLYHAGGANITRCVSWRPVKH